MILPVWFNNQTRKNMINKQDGSVTFSLIMSASDTRLYQAETWYFTENGVVATKQSGD